MEILSRRELFKRIGKVLPALIVAGSPVFVIANELGESCKNSCTINCQSTCKQHCRMACSEDPCGGACFGRCKGTCGSSVMPKQVKS